MKEILTNPSDVSFKTPNGTQKKPPILLSPAKSIEKSVVRSPVRDHSLDSEGQKLNHSHSPSQKAIGGRHCAVCDQRRKMRE